VFAAASLSGHWEAARDFAKDASGVLVLAVARSPPTYILWFRPELLETVCWGGNPDKPIEIGSGDLPQSLTGASTAKVAALPGDARALA